jgi:hypothetical protein
MSRDGTRCRASVLGELSVRSLKRPGTGRSRRRKRGRGPTAPLALGGRPRERPRRRARNTDSKAPGRQVDDVGAECGAGGRPMVGRTARQPGGAVTRVAVRGQGRASGGGSPAPVPARSPVGGSTAYGAAANPLTVKDRFTTQMRGGVSMPSRTGARRKKNLTGVADYFIRKRRLCCW